MAPTWQSFITCQNSRPIEFPVGNVIYETGDIINNLRVSPRGDWLAFVQHPPYRTGAPWSSSAEPV